MTKMSLIVVAVVVLLVGVAGGVFLVIRAVDPGSDDPVEVTEGEAFDLDGITYHDGWEVVVVPQEGDFPRVDVESLEANLADEDDRGSTAAVTFTFFDGDEEVFEISCFSDKRIFDEPRTIDCNDRTAEMPDYDRIKASVP